MTTQISTAVKFAPIAAALKIKPEQVESAISLFDSGNTIPFVARYRKEVTGNLDEDQLRQVKRAWERQRTLHERRATIMATIEEQGNLNPELARMLRAADSLTALEDLYQPFRPRRRTRATTAREAGLEPLAKLILAQEPARESALTLAGRLTPDGMTPAEALARAQDIVAEHIADDTTIRQTIREKARRWGTLRATRNKKVADERQTYALYYEYAARIDRLRPHQVLALNRGERDKILRIAIEIDERDWLVTMRNVYRPDRRSPFAAALQAASEDGAKRLLLPAIRRDLRRSLTEAAEAHAIALFARNLRGLLLQPPVSGHTILALDPAFRTGCKLAVIDNTGRVLATDTIYPHPPQKQREAALKRLSEQLSQYDVTLIVIGNGTASRETEELVAELVRNTGELQYMIVNEAGASVYSASPLAREELPDLDVSLRGAVSIGRRVLDPLAELVKIDPRSIGVGLYQHDVDQKQLAQALDDVVESVVNQVGVEVNSASPALLAHVSGIGSSLAENIVAFRDTHGRIPDRRALLQIPGLGPKAFEQSAGFLRIRDGRDPLDATAIHPESYGAARALLQRLGLPANPPTSQVQEALAAAPPTTELAADLGVGLPTLSDMVEQLTRPGRDPRDDLPPPALRKDVLSMEDLRPGMVLEGTVRNVVDFGAFVDVAVKQDGLLHRSQFPSGSRPRVGQSLRVTILNVDLQRGRISLGWADTGDT